MPRVSIITPVYNCTEEQLIRTRISLKNQTSGDYEWIIVDDGSNKLQTFAHVYLEANYGPSVARNIGFQISNGDIITYLDMGDILYEDRVEGLIKNFDDYKIDLLFSAYDIEYPHGAVEIIDHLDTIGKHPLFPTAFEYIQLLENQNITVPLGVAHTRKPFVECGGFQRGIVCGEDGILWRRMYEKLPLNKILFSDHRAGRYYVSKDGQSRTQRRFQMGGFAFDGNKNDNGRYLDEEWYKNYWSEDLYE